MKAIEVTAIHSCKEITNPMLIDLLGLSSSHIQHSKRRRHEEYTVVSEFLSGVTALDVLVHKCILWSPPSLKLTSFLPTQRPEETHKR